ncbi:gluconate transporter inducer Gti1 [Mitosporidium daphniae]|uniref:Gluconate transporter inducer Gti1 n=1 Tax=Mitosporidium daphniae TaxID=1485682 RepID=A0A098VUW1_9MICR|nr:gluconate transporter inducer Gti1 [Mitosporidium daphniae]KGG52664.1 gluconate transporter inducer Gti1 [Mitosporidium daphniae]|eukprot:XP_013239100.1 gluconate transporter inducer Gti1 [Mitosporidium daphniae]
MENPQIQVRSEILDTKFKSSFFSASSPVVITLTSNSNGSESIGGENTLDIMKYSENRTSHAEQFQGNFTCNSNPQSQLLSEMILPTCSSSTQASNDAPKSLFIIREDGLIKKTLSMTIDGQLHHLVCYYSKSDFFLGKESKGLPSIPPSDQIVENDISERTFSLSRFGQASFPQILPKTSICNKKDTHLKRKRRHSSNSIPSDYSSVGTRKILPSTAVENLSGTSRMAGIRANSHSGIFPNAFYTFPQPSAKSNMSSQNLNGFLATLPMPMTRGYYFPNFPTNNEQENSAHFFPITTDPISNAFSGPNASIPLSSNGSISEFANPSIEQCPFPLNMSHIPFGDGYPQFVPPWNHDFYIPPFVSTPFTPPTDCRFVGSSPTSVSSSCNSFSSSSVMNPMVDVSFSEQACSQRISCEESSSNELSSSYGYDNYFPSEDILNSKFPSEDILNSKFESEDLLNSKLLQSESIFTDELSTNPFLDSNFDTEHVIPKLSADNPNAIPNS